MTTEDLNYVIKAEVKLPDGSLNVSDAFTWRGPAEAGIQRAKEEAKNFGLKIVRVWAEKL